MSFSYRRYIAISSLRRYFSDKPAPQPGAPVRSMIQEAYEDHLLEAPYQQGSRDMAEHHLKHAMKNLVGGKQQIAAQHLGSIMGPNIDIDPRTIAAGLAGK
jgi:hypothetical protein